MEVNIENTKVMKFSGCGHKCKTIFLYNEKPTENIYKCKYLEIKFGSAGVVQLKIFQIGERRHSFY